MNASQCRAARALIALHQADLAKDANVSLSALKDFEREKRLVGEKIVSALQAALEAKGLEFIVGGVRKRLAP